MDKFTTFTGIPAAPVDVSIDLPHTGKGLADGAVTVTLDPAAQADKVRLYWGGKDGQPLNGYGILAETRPAGYADGALTNPTVITLPEGLIIPDGAVSILARTVLADAESTGKAAALPADTGSVGFGSPLLSFEVVSDLHITKNREDEYTANVARMLADVKKRADESVGIMVAGDIADTTDAAEYQMLTDLIAENEKMPLYMVTGDHDLRGFGDPQVEFFKQYAGNDGLWFDRWINGYHFIFLARLDGPCRTPLPEEELDWLRETIAEKAEPTKPIFVFCHESAVDTVAGSSDEEGWWGIGNPDEFCRIMAAYPQAMFFTGHSHWQLASKNEYYPADGRMCSCFNTASVGYLWTALDKVTGELLHGSEGLAVTVYDNGVTLVQGRDYVNNKWIAAAQYAVFGADFEPVTKPAAPAKVALDLKRAAEGWAEGTVTVTLEKGYPFADKLLLYWGDENGRPLDGYGILSRARPSGYVVARKGFIAAPKGDPAAPTVIRLPRGLIIPDGAKTVLAQVINAAGESDYAAAPLPDEAVPFAFGKPLAEFQVVSDLHVVENANDDNTRHVGMMLRDIAETCPESLGIMVAGDITNRGRQAQYDLMRKMINETPNVPPLWCVMGNHDYWAEDQAEQIEIFKRFAGNDSLWFDKWLGGYHFIFITGDHGACRLDLPEEEIRWLREKLDENADPSRPIFVFCHQSVLNTIAGSDYREEWWGLCNGDVVGRVLAAHPEAFFFNGHSHWELASDNEYYPANERLCHGFNTSSVGYLWTSLDVDPGEYLYGSEGLYVTVYDNGVTLVRGRDFVNRKWIAAAQFAVESGENAAS